MAIHRTIRRDVAAPARADRSRTAAGPPDHRSPRSFRWAALVGAGLLVALLGAVPAHAGADPTSPPPGASGSPVDSHGLSTARSGGTTDRAPSTYQAGYESTPASGPLNASTRTFRVPDLACLTADIRGQAIGIGYEPEEGAPVVLADVFVACVSEGLPFYKLDALACGPPGTGELMPQAGDKIRASVQRSGGMVTATVENLTQGDIATSTGFTGNCTRNIPSVVHGTFPLYHAAEKIPVEPFETRLTKDKVNGECIEPASVVRYTRTDLGKITAGPIERCSFTLTGS